MPATLNNLPCVWQPPTPLVATPTIPDNIKWSSEHLHDSRRHRISGSIIQNGTRHTSCTTVSDIDLYRCSESPYDAAVTHLQIQLRASLTESMANLSNLSTQTTVSTTPMTATALATAYTTLNTNTMFTTTGNETYGYGIGCATSASDYSSYIEMTWNNGTHSWVDNSEQTKKTKLLKKIRSQLQICVPRRGELITKVQTNEAKAIDTLREEMSETEFRRYIKYGFVLVPGKSGKTYQIFRSQDHTKVWKGGKLLEEICVRIADYGIPPTDNVIAFKTMIETDEDYFRKCGNVYINKNGCLQRVRAA